MVHIIPAILTSEKKELDQRMTALRGKVSWVQIDIMDGEFVPHTSIEIESVTLYRDAFSLEAHLMVNHPLQYIQRCKKSGVKRITFHSESLDDPRTVLQQIMMAGMETGIALNPETTVADVASVVPITNRVLLLGVHPGAQGQTFIPDVLKKVRQIRDISSETIVALDGGVNEATVAQIIVSGITEVVVGSALFQKNDVGDALKRLQGLTKE